jgi:Glycosyl transferases group 1
VTRHARISVVAPHRPDPVTRDRANELGRLLDGAGLAANSVDSPGVVHVMGRALMPTPGVATIRELAEGGTPVPSDSAVIAETHHAAAVHRSSGEPPASVVIMPPAATVSEFSLHRPAAAQFQVAVVVDAPNDGLELAQRIARATSSCGPTGTRVRVILPWCRDEVPGLGPIVRPRSLAHRKQLWAQNRVVLYSPATSHSGRVVTELLASGCAIVAPGWPEIREVLQDKNTARLYHPANVVAGVRMVAELVDDEHAAARLGEQAREYAVERLDWSRVLPRLLATYDMAA